jgi:hypothetical protein
MSDSGERIRDHIRHEIRALEQKVDAAQADLETERGPDDEVLVSRIMRLQAEIGQKEADLKESEAAQDPPLTDPHVFGWEITQGLVEYELVAGKDTVVRVFVGLDQPRVQLAAPADFGEGTISLPKGFHFDTPWGGVSRLDYASLEVTKPDGTRFEVPGTMLGEFTVGPRSLSEEDNVNFYIDGELLSRTGYYGFVARFYRDGRVVGTLTMSKRRLLDTADLRLLIKVTKYPMPDAAWDTLLRALEYLQRNLPVRAGAAPMDSDLDAGLRFYIDPAPYDSGWPEWEEAKAALEAFNQRQQELGNPDRADKLMNVRTQQDGESASDLGGVGETPGVISGVQLATDPPGDSYFASIVSQEIGHNFGLMHVLERPLPFATPFDVLNRRSLQEAHSIMFQAVGVTSPSERRLFHPDHWSKIRQTLLTFNSTGPT